MSTVAEPQHDEPQAEPPLSDTEEVRLRAALAALPAYVPGKPAAALPGR